MTASVTDQPGVLTISTRPVLARSVAAVLAPRGWRCEAAADVPGATAMLRQARYALLTCDAEALAGSPAEVGELAAAAAGVPLVVLASDAEPPVPLAVLTPRPARHADLAAQAAAVLGERPPEEPVPAAPCLEQLERLREAGDALAAGPDTPLRSFLASTYRNLAGSLADLAAVTDALAGQAPAQPQPCHLMNCPRLEDLTAALVETVAVLDRTRQAFKSRELGELRRKLDAILRKGAAESGPSNSSPPAGGR